MSVQQQRTGGTELHLLSLGRLNETGIRQAGDKVHTGEMQEKLCKDAAGRVAAIRADWNRQQRVLLHY
jgi:hypothetical protein